MAPLTRVKSCDFNKVRVNKGPKDRLKISEFNSASPSPLLTQHRNTAAVFLEAPFPTHIYVSVYSNNTCLLGKRICEISS